MDDLGRHSDRTQFFPKIIVPKSGQPSCGVKIMIFSRDRNAAIIEGYSRNAGPARYAWSDLSGLIEQYIVDWGDNIGFGTKTMIAAAILVGAHNVAVIVNVMGNP